MRRLPRLDRSIDLLRARSLVSQSSSFLCSTCRARAPFSTSIRLAQPDPIPRSERLRRRIWGTSEPPGLRDPYRGPSPEEIEEAELKEENVAEEAQTRPSRTPAPKLDPSYEPAKTWDGLEEVGDLPPPEFDYEGWFSSHLVHQDPNETTAALRRAVVEAFTLIQAGRPLSELSIAGHEGDDYTGEVQISVPQSNPSAPVFHFTKNSSEETILRSFTETCKVAVEKYMENPLAELTKDRGEYYKELVASWDPAWLWITLDDPEIKFAVVKRVMKLIGTRIPDSAMNFHTLRSFHVRITEKPKPPTVYHALLERSDLVNLPNVKIFNRRITPIDREKMVGRWKIIEKELKSRGLPVTGHSS